LLSKGKKHVIEKGLGWKIVSQHKDGKKIEADCI